MTTRDVKAAREVLEELVTEREFQRLANRITDAAATPTPHRHGRPVTGTGPPRAMSVMSSPRASRADLPEPGAFRKALW